MRNRGRKPYYWLTGALIACLIVCGLGYMALIAIAGPDAGQVQVQIARAKELGLPLQPSDLVRKVDDSENAASRYKLVFERVSKVEKKVNLGWSPSKEPAGAAEAEKSLNGDKALVTDIIAAARFPHCDFHKDYSLGAALAFPEISPMKTMGKILCFDAVSKAHKQKINNSVEDLGAAMRLAAHVREEPTIINFLVSISIESMVHGAIARIVDETPRDASTVAALLNLARSFGPLPDIRDSLRSEVVFGQVTISQVHTINDFRMFGGSPDQSDGNFGVNFSIPASVRDSWRARHLRMFNQLYSSFPKENDWKKMADLMGEVDRKVSEDTSIANKMNQLLCPVFTGTALSVGRMQADRNLTVTMLELLQKPTLPSNLKGFGSEAQDPFGTGQLHYKPKGKGFLLYSVGTDKKDDGGARTSGRASMTYDIVREVK